MEVKSELLGNTWAGAQGRFTSRPPYWSPVPGSFPRGAESSSVWVTTLDKAKPVKEARVQIQDCQGTVLWAGPTDGNGIARVGSLPRQNAIARCSYHPLDNGLLVSARLGNDLAFVHSSWNEGIESWRFQLPMSYNPSLLAAHTIFDRTLFRAGETVHMKHLLRKRVLEGFALLPENKRPTILRIQHLGSDQKYEFPLQWDAQGIAETNWAIPQGAKLGQYQVSLVGPEKQGRAEEFSGEFRVEEYRVPLMKGSIVYPAEPLVSPSTVRVDLSASYLSGGGAGNLPIKFRHQLEPRYVPPFDGFEDFVFSNGAVKEGLFRGGEEMEGPAEKKPLELKSLSLTLDKAGSIRTQIADLPKLDGPLELLGELEFRDPNGETQTVSARAPLWPANWAIGIKPDSWALSKDSLKFQVAVTDLKGNPVPEALVAVDLLEQKTYSHRKRLVGGFYAYEHSEEVKKLQQLCQGKTNAKGLLTCEAVSPVSGNVILQASVKDPAGLETTAHQSVWVAGKNQQWFRASDDDRIDVIPEKKRYEVGDTARFQVRMPFAEATALVTMEREGVGEAIVQELSGKAPVLEIPVKDSFSPNIFVSVLLVRGRVGDVQPTATVDLGRPAYKLGIAEIAVGWRPHELKVKVSPEKSVYKIREKARVGISVRTAEGNVPPAGSEVAVAAVDEGLLELMPNGSWQLLAAMMGRRSYSVQTSTAQSQVIGKRHFGLKALTTGGGGGKQITRELFDTLLLWKGRVPLDGNGDASVEIPLNDSLTSFRIVAIANSGVGRFGTGSASIRSTQDLMLLSGIAPVVREGDQYRSEFTLRNTTDRGIEVALSSQIKELKDLLPPLSVTLGAGESQTVGWNVSAPLGVDMLHYTLEAQAKEGAHDRLAVQQKVIPAVPVRVFQATLQQVDQKLSIEVERPQDALPGRGGIQVLFRPTLVEGMSGVVEYMRNYPYICLEQEASRAIALRDETRWKKVMDLLPSFLDSDGLAKYFPTCLSGSDALTAYLLSIAQEAGWKIPEQSQSRMAEGLKGFIEGRVRRYSALPTADLSIRKLAAVEALTRLGQGEPRLLSSITIEPNLWPTSAVIHWFNILQKLSGIPDQAEKLKAAEQILRSRLNFQGTIMGFSTERSDYLWWLMVSNDSNAVRLVLSTLDLPAWKPDLPKITRGALGRQKQGRWDTTVANAWGVLAMEKFSRTFESTPLTGNNAVMLAGKTETQDWSASPRGNQFDFPWPPQRAALSITPANTGSPWTTIQSRAAIPLKSPFSSGYKITKTLTPIDQKSPGSWHQGDLVRVKLQIEAQTDMTWVVVSDPIPGGASILGTGLGRDSQLATQGEVREGWVWPAFEERSFEAFRAYYEYVPKGEWTVEYTFRLNNPGLFHLPPTRVEAMYSPEMFGEMPNDAVKVVKEGN
ncbi:MAG: MG2 domain-containing protein [Terriglobia bacterium]